MRTNTSAGSRWNRNYTESHQKQSKFIRVQSDSQPVRKSVMHTNKNIITDISDRRKSSDKRIAEKELVKGIVRNNQKQLRSKYGDNELIQSQHLSDD